MANQNVIKLVRESIEAFNAGDAKKFGTALADNSVYEEMGTQRKVQGRDNIVKTVFEWRQAFPDVKGTIQKIVASGNTAALEIVWEGTHNGALVGPGGTIPASGKRARVPASQVVTVEGGKIKQTNHYFDMMTLLQQIGAAAPASK